MDEAGGASTLSDLRKVYNGWRRLGARCLLCGEGTAGGGLCGACHADLARPAGVVCARQLAFIDAGFAAFEYTYPLDGIIRDCKFSRDLAALALCGSLLESEVSPHLPGIDLVVAVPLSARRYIARGYNQAREIARPLVAARGFRFASGVRRRRHRVPQSRLPAAARAANVRGAFACTRRYAGERILIVDDVITTGATIVELARTLRAAGAGPIYAAALAVVSG